MVRANRGPIPRPSNIISTIDISRKPTSVHNVQEIHLLYMPYVLLSAFVALPKSMEVVCFSPLMFFARLQALGVIVSLKEVNRSESRC